MPATRRQFLNKLGVSLVAAAGILLFPRNVLAGGWGRRRRYCCPPPCCPAPLAGHSLTLLPPYSPGDVVPAYPPPVPFSTYTIPGNGGFYCWGKLGTTGITNLSVQATDNNGNPLSVQPTVQTVTTLPIPCDWALAVSYPNQSNFYLVYTYSKNGVPGQTSVVCGPYST